MFTKNELEILLKVMRKVSSDNESEMEIILALRKKLVNEINETNEE